MTRGSDVQEEARSERRAISGVDSSITAFVGRAARGVTDTPVTVTDFTEFERVFGGRWKGSALGDSVHDFFENGGTTAVIVRLYRSAPGRAAKPSVSRLPIRGLELVAADEGSWGNALRARVDFDTRPFEAALGEHETSLFNLVLRDSTTGVIEEHRDVVVAPANHPRLVTRILEAESRLVRATRVGRARPPASHPLADPGKTVWDDNRVPTNAKVTISASDGRALTRASFIGTGLKAARRGLFALDKSGSFSLLVVPPHTPDGSVDAAVVRAAAAYCEQRRAFHIVDAPPTWTGVADVTSAFAAGFDTVVGTTSANAALFFPRLRRSDPQPDAPAATSAAAGAVAGVIARTDALRGVWNAPAGVDATLHAVGEPAVALTDGEIGQLTPIGVNCLRSVPGAGPVVWGARTMQGADQTASEWKYIPVRRTALFIEESVARGTRWVVFEPNGDALWAEIRLHVETFMLGLFRAGAFPGSSPRDAFFVRCDETTTQADVYGGVVNIEVGFAPLRPAEFVVIRIQQTAGPLAQRIPPRADWSDLDVTEEQVQRLEVLCRQVRERDTTDLARGAARDRGVAVLFVGDTRVATTAADVVAHDLGRDLYRVDLAAVVSKYIGETEKNLRALFDTAEAGGAVLLFDDADALFGARSDVKDSHDRYANLDIADLIQRIEASCGVAIITTNRRSSIDPDILRRLRPVVELRAERD